MKKIEQFTNQYPVSKTLRFSLIPQGKTAENFDVKLLLEEDEKRAAEYEIVKGYIDRYHKKFIEEVLSNLKLQDLSSYAELYYKPNKKSDEKAEMEKKAIALRKAISKAFAADRRFKDLFSKEIIRELLPEMLTDEEEISILHGFYDFTTYFTGFHENRKNMYSEEAKSTSIAFRLIDQNLPRFLDNRKIGMVVLDTLPSDVVKTMNIDLAEKIHVEINRIFEIEFFNEVLAQSGIDIYNQLIGGYTTDDGRKVKGINEYINEYNQSSKTRIPKLRPLYKQILSDRGSLSFIPAKFSSSQEVLDSINAFYILEDSESGKNGKEVIELLGSMLKELGGRDLNKIYIPSGLDITALSNKVFGNWAVIQSGLEQQYDELNGAESAKNKDKFIEKRNKYFKSINSFSLAELQHAGDVVLGPETKSITDYYTKTVAELLNSINTAYADVSSLLSTPYPEQKKLFQQDADIEKIKTFLDAIKEYQRFLKPLLGTGLEEEKDYEFYSSYSVLYDQFDLITVLYNRVRDYATQKPYSNEKIKLNFNNAQLLGGWDRNKETDNANIILMKENNFYLGIMAKDCRKSFSKIPEVKPGESVYKKMVYKQIPDAAKYISSKQIIPQNPPEDIIRILKKKKENPGSLSIEEIRRFIEYASNDFLVNYPLIRDENNIPYFNFHFKRSDEYSSLKEFFKDVENQSYSMRFVNIPVGYVDELVNDGKLYLFQIYNKDFSPYSKGTPNLHTLYFRMLFNEKNLENNIIWLKGGAEMFYRKASIEPSAQILHPANNPIKNKNPLNPKKESTFEYDLVKDKRYTQRSFSLHLPIQINPTSEGFVKTNENVRHALRGCDNNYVIGIDRGERNLLYIVVIDGKGNIVEQQSLNSIINEYNGISHETDYHAMLDAKEKERDKARKDWKQVGNIKNIKEGYISQVVHVICKLVEKYDAVIAMEDLNFGFKNIRSGVEKSVYQKFEKMLIDKLNLCVFKDREPEEIGGALCGYQLTEKFESFKKMGKQNGFLFYIPAWNTSKIDPTTGFVNLLNTKYESIDSSRKFFSSFDSIRYNKEKDYFEFELDYSKFPRGIADYQKKWTLTTFGKRIKSFRNPAQNSEWDSELVDLTATFKEVFTDADIDYNSSNLQNDICAIKEKTFFVNLLYACSLMLQMRNSITGTDVDYLTSPVMNASGKFFNTNEAGKYSKTLPIDADANGAYNIARKGLWAIEQIKVAEESDVNKVKLAMTNAQWLEYAQTHV